MTTKRFDHGTAFEQTFTVTLRGEVEGQPVGWGCDSHEKEWLEKSLLVAVKIAVERYYQCQLHGVYLQVSLPDAKPPAGVTALAPHLEGTDPHRIVHHKRRLTLPRPASEPTTRTEQTARLVTLPELQRRFGLRSTRAARKLMRLMAHRELEGTLQTTEGELLAFLTALAPHHEGTGPEQVPDDGAATEIIEARSIIAGAPLPARPCAQGSPPGDGDPRWLVRFAGVPLCFEIHGGKPIALMVGDEDASLFPEREIAVKLVVAVFGPVGPENPHITIETYPPPQPENLKT